jgi:hypothetical protein
VSDTRIERVRSTERESGQVIAVNAADLRKLDELKIAYRKLDEAKTSGGTRKLYRTRKLAATKKPHGLANLDGQKRSFYGLVKPAPKKADREGLNSWIVLPKTSPLYGPKGSSWTKLRLLSSAESLMIEPQDQLKYLKIKLKLIEQMDRTSQAGFRPTEKKSPKNALPKPKKMKNL